MKCCSDMMTSFCFKSNAFKRCLLQNRAEHIFITVSIRPFWKKQIVLKFYLRRTGGLVGRHPPVCCQLNNFRMCIGIISWTSLITSHIALVNQELSPFNYRNYLKWSCQLNKLRSLCPIITKFSQNVYWQNISDTFD